MQSKKKCSHFTNLKKEQISNQIKGDLSVCHNAKSQKCKPDELLWLCLSCGFVGCGRNSENQCALKHNESSKHNMAISISSYIIWCYVCDDDFETLLENCNNEAQRKKMEGFLDSVKQLLYSRLKQISKSQVNQFIQTSQQPQAQEEKQQQQQDNRVSPLNYTPKQIFGLRNLGNTCFFNSVVQCLNGARKLNEYYLNIKDYNFSIQEHIQDEDDDGWVTVQKQQNNKKQSKPKNQINSIYQSFLINSQKQKGNLVDPSELFKAVSAIFGRFRNMAQQDAQELLRCLLDGLNTCEEKTVKGKINLEHTEGKPKRTIVENVFGSYLCNYLECLECGYISRTFDFCLDYPIQIREQKKNVQAKQPKGPYTEIDDAELQSAPVPYIDRNILVQKNFQEPKMNKGVNLNLYDCLDAFTEYELLNLQKNYFKCEQCSKNGKKSGQAIRKFFLYDLPQVVTITLKRFQQKGNGRFEKVGDHVEFPEVLDLSDYTLLKGAAKYTVEEIVELNRDQQKYQLFGVVVHQGTMQGGHYIAYVKHREQNQDHWFYFSDSNFKEVTLKNVLHSQAYMLFYEKI